MMTRRLGLLGVAMLATCSLAIAADTAARGEQRLRPDEFDFSTAKGGATGSSGIAQVQTLVLSGNPDTAGLYTILLRVPPHTRIAAHSHPDDRVGSVVAGTFNIGYGASFDASRLKPMPPGSFYTEPAGALHFAESGDTTVVVQITGYGPSGVHYAAPAP